MACNPYWYYLDEDSKTLVAKSNERVMCSFKLRGGDEPRPRQYVNGNPLHYTIPREEFFKYAQNIELIQLLLPHLDINALVGRHRNEQI